MIPFAIQILMYVSPVIFPLGLLPSRFHAVLALNPMCGIIEGYRSAILGTPWKPVPLAISTASTLAMFVLGIFYFRKTEARFADIARVASHVAATPASVFTPLQTEPPTNPSAP